MNPTPFFSFFLILLAIVCQLYGYISPYLLNASYGVGEINIGLFNSMLSDKVEQINWYGEKKLDFYQYTVIAAGISMLFMALPLLLLMFSCCFSSNKSLRESIALFTFLNVFLIGGILWVFFNVANLSVNTLREVQKFTNVFVNIIGAISGVNLGKIEIYKYGSALWALAVAAGASFLATILQFMFIQEKKPALRNGETVPYITLNNRQQE